MRTSLALLALVLITLGIPAGASAQISDQRLAQQVAAAVRSCPQFGIFDDVEINVTNREVTLNGRVLTPVTKEDIARRVSKIDGVRSLTNNLGVLPASQTDDALRRKIAQSIYGHPSFWNYAQMADQPIHIIVENGRVTLTGVVFSQIDKALAYSLSQVGDSLGVSNRLQVER